jgi:hypothetical protein
MNKPSPMQLEKYIVTDCEDILHNAPLEAIETYRESLGENVPSAFARYNNRWYVISTAGQGPMIIWEGL